MVRGCGKKVKDKRGGRDEVLRDNIVGERDEVERKRVLKE